MSQNVTSMQDSANPRFSRLGSESIQPPFVGSRKRLIAQKRVDEDFVFVYVNHDFEKTRGLDRTNMTDRVPGKADHLKAAASSIVVVDPIERRQKLTEALRLSIGSGRSNSHRVDVKTIAPSDIRTSREIAEDVKLPIDQLNIHKIVLTKFECVEYLLHCGINMDLKSFRVISTERLHGARFGDRRLGERSGGGHLFSYQELCIIAQESMALAFTI